MKRIVSIILATVLVISLAGCGKGRTLYNYDLSEYVSVGDYAVTVDTASEEYLDYLGEFDEQFADALRAEVTTGKVEDGDTINIDYKGYLDGEAFDGGSDEGYDLTIGSGTFIKGFEESLIGCEVGTTVDIKVTFPANYGVESLNGKETTFTVKINSKIELEPVNTGNVKTLGYDSLEAYNKAKKEYAVINVAWDIIYDNSKVIEYPEKEMDRIFNETVKFLEDACKKNDMTLDDFIAYNGMTKDSFNEYLRENDVKYSVYNDLICYRILDLEKYKLTEEDITNGKKDLESGTQGQNITYTSVLIEERAAYLAARKIILDKVTIK